MQLAASHVAAAQFTKSCRSSQGQGFHLMFISSIKMGEMISSDFAHGMFVSADLLRFLYIVQLSHD